MSEQFDYNEVPMGVVPKRRRDYRLSFADDYRLKRLTQSVKLNGGRMLDIGCGGGLLTESLVYYYPKTKIYGYDVSNTAIKYAKMFGSGKVKYRIAETKRIPFRDNFFDVCICLDVMEHIPDVDFFLKEVKRILRKDGKFFLAVPCEGQPLTFTWLFQKIKIGNKLTYKNWGHIHPEFTHKYVSELLERYGFTIEKETYSEHLPYQVVNLFTYFWPKEILNLILGKNAAKYYDRGIVKKEMKRERKSDVFDIMRKVWLFMGSIFNGLALSAEVELLKKLPFTAWKIHLLSTVDKP